MTAEISTPTAKQKLALMLERAGHSHATIAKKMRIKNRETATRLIIRARAAEKAFLAAVADFIAA